jgi:hypothetical protein
VRLAADNRDTMQFAARILDSHPSRFENQSGTISVSVIFYETS